MRAVLSFSQRLVVLVAGRKIADGDPQDVVRQRRCRGGVSWQLASSIAGLDAGYGAVSVLHGVSLDVREGETVALLGTNGNGKSTLMKCVMGMVRPTAGSIDAEIDGARHESGRHDDRGDRRSGHRLRAGGTAAVSAPDGDRKPADGRVSQRAARASIARNLAFCFEVFPRLAERRQATRRLHERRRAADAGAGARADVGAEAAADRRADRSAWRRCWCARTIDRIKELKDRLSA